MATDTVSPDGFTLRPERVATCHPDRKVCARGLCNSCYLRWKDKHKTTRAKCHPDRVHRAHGLCHNCYKTRLDRNKPHHRRSAIWRKAALKHTFGITPEQHDQMREAQGNACGMCRQAFGTTRSNRPNVDHCHATGKIRGLLCFRCNTGLGYVERYRERADSYLASGLGL